MATTTRTIEGIDLDTRTGLWCDCCCTFNVTAVQVGLVDASTLELLRTGDRLHLPGLRERRIAATEARCPASGSAPSSDAPN